jgi:MFS family permease
VPVLGLCVLASTASVLMVFTMLGQIGAALHASAALVNWIVIATIITATVSLALFPAVGDVIGQRRLMVAALACLAVGSLVCALAPSAVALLIGRIIAAPGAAATPLSVALVRGHRSGPGLPRALGVMAAFAGAAAAAGFTVGGAVEEAARADWHAVFWVMAVLCAIIGILAAVAIPGDEAKRAQSPDVPGALLLAAGLTAALLPVTEGAAWGWTSPQVLGLLAGALLLLTAWLVTQRRRPDPLVRLGAFALPGVLGGTLLFLVTGATVGIVNLTVPAFLEAPAAAGYGTAASVLVAGLDLLPFALGITAAGFLVGRLAGRVPVFAIAVVALASEALALGLLAGFHRGAVQVVLLAALFGAGHGGTVTAEFILLTRAVPPAAVGGVTGLASAANGVSGSVASAVTSALLVATVVHVSGTAFPTAADYSHAWLTGAAIAAAGALTVAAAGQAARKT